MFYKLGWFGRGVAASRRAIDKGASDRAHVWDALACNLEASGRDAMVPEAFEKPITLREDDVETTWNALAKLCERTGRKDKAEEVRQKIRTHEKPNHCNMHRSNRRISGEPLLEAAEVLEGL